jgi:glyoxylase-like metal-dependent hydrolase (beta-lactamase superfamily II)
MAVFERFTHGPVSGLRVGRVNLGINTTFVVYAYNDVLIDSGPINQWRHVANFVRSHEINHLLLTHHHEDHSGNAANILNELAIPTFTNALCQQKIKQAFSIPTIQRYLWGTAKPLNAQQLQNSFESNQGVKLDVLLTPGHTDDMSCFYDAEHGFLFTGDLYIASRVMYLHKDEDLMLQIESLNKVISLDFNTVFCPHRGIMKNGKKDLIRKRDFILELIEQVNHLAKQGMNVTQIQKKLLGREDSLSIFSNFDFSKKRLIESCLKLK